MRNLFLAFFVCFNCAMATPGPTVINLVADEEKAATSLDTMLMAHTIASLSASTKIALEVSALPNIFASPSIASSVRDGASAALSLARAAIASFSAMLSMRHATTSSQFSATRLPASARATPNKLSIAEDNTGLVLSIPRREEGVLCPVGRGNPNSGNICPLTSFVQLVISSTLVRSVLSTNYEQCTCFSDTGVYCTPCLFWIAAENLAISTPYSVADPLPVPNAFTLLATRLHNIGFIFGRQHDVNELALKFIGWLKENIHFTDLFGKKESSVVTCATCKNSSTSKSPGCTDIITLPLPPASATNASLQTSLNAYYSAEDLGASKNPKAKTAAGQTNLYDCLVCKKKTPATKKLQLDVAPKVALLAITRHKSASSGPLFDATKVSLPNELNFGAFFSTSAVAALQASSPGHVTKTNGVDSATLMYDIVGFVNFSGTDLAGHYTANVKRQADAAPSPAGGPPIAPAPLAWYLYNDAAAVVQSTLDLTGLPIDSSVAYLALYQVNFIHVFRSTAILSPLPS